QGLHGEGLPVLRLRVRGTQLQRDDREDATKVVILTPLRALLSGVVDYAGLFPPAALDMPDAVRSYGEYHRSDDAWMLGRFVVPVSRLSDFESAWCILDAGARTGWRLSGLLGDDLAPDVARIQAFNAAHAP